MDAPFDTTGDPVADLILAGRASTVDEAEELYLDTHLDEVLLARGSRAGGRGGEQLPRVRDAERKRAPPRA